MVSLGAVGLPDVKQRHATQSALVHLIVIGLGLTKEGGREAPYRHGHRRRVASAGRAEDDTTIGRGCRSSRRPPPQWEVLT